MINTRFSGIYVGGDFDTGHVTLAIDFEKLVPMTPNYARGVAYLLIQQAKCMEDWEQKRRDEE